MEKYNWIVDVQWQLRFVQSFPRYQLNLLLSNLFSDVDDLNA